jgi:diacylglycerol kinase family enzyme
VAPQRLVLLSNPVSSNAALSKRRIELLEDSLDPETLPLIKLSTEADQTHTTRKLQDILLPGDWLCLFGGDGTVNSTVTALLTNSALENVRTTPVVPLGGGYCNDITANLQAPAVLHQPQRILQAGRIEQVTPLKCDIVAADGATSRQLAIGYLSLGATGHAAHELDISRASWTAQAPFMRAMHAGRIVAQRLLRAQTYTVEDCSGINESYEHLFVNGEIMAGFMPFPVKLTEAYAEEYIVPNRQLRTLAAFIGQSLFRTLHGIPLTPGVEVAFRLHDATYLQRDGEPSLLPAGSTVQIGFNSVPFYAVQTKP